MEYSSRLEYIFLYEYTHFNTICMEVSVVVEYFCPGTVYILTIKTRLMYIYLYIYIYICNELIEETGGHRKLIFGMWESFGYGSSKF